MSAVLLVAGYVTAVSLASLRWLRVAQREHYHVWRVSLFALRWWRSSAANVVLVMAAVGGGIAAALLGGWVRVAVATAAFAAMAAGPLGLGIKGRTAPLRWTRRLRVVAGLTLLLTGGVVLVAATTGSLWLLALAAVLHPVVVEAALAFDVPIERVLTGRYVQSARRKVSRVDPLVVGITGSYGKTTVKVYSAHLLGSVRKTLATRSSYNNRLGLALSVNADLGIGTEVFVAEMGTYGRGEIAELCSWLRPRIGVITAIGPVHLERMGSVANIVEAKSEIVEDVDTAVLNIDVPELRELAQRLRRQGRHVVACSESVVEADVVVRRRGDATEVRLGHRTEQVRPLGEGVVPVNVALALGVCLAADALPPSLEDALQGLPPVANRLTVSRASGERTVIDDTYNSNPAGARRALDVLAATAVETGAKMVVVTPGMVELGPLQHSENAAFAKEAAALGSALVVVGRTNRTALVEGYRSGGGEEPVTVANRDEAIDWVRAHTAPGDVVLYENDLPDHFP